MAKLTMQQVYDRVWERLNDGTGRAFIIMEDGHTRCMYLTEDGIKCAIGIFIPDGHRAQKYKTEFVGTVFDKNHDIRELFEDNIENEFFYFIQCTHDRERNWTGNEFNEKGKEEFADIGKKYNLTLPEGLV